MLGLLGRAVPMTTVLFFAAAGVIPWVAILIVAAFRRAATVEEFEVESLRRSGESARTIFDR